MTQGILFPRSNWFRYSKVSLCLCSLQAAGTTAQMLADMNGISNPLELAAGTVLKVPGS